MHANYVCDAVVTFCEAMDAADCERDHNFRVGFFLTFTYKFQYCVIRKIAFSDWCSPISRAVIVVAFRDISGK